MKKIILVLLILFAVPLFAQMDTDSTRNVVPRTNHYGQVGTMGKYWRSAHFDSLFVTYFSALQKSDSTTMPGYVTRTMILTDTTNRNALLALKVAKADSSTMPGYVTRTQITTDSTNRNALLALKVAKADSSLMPGYVTRTQFATDSTYRKNQEATKQAIIFSRTNQTITTSTADDTLSLAHVKIGSNGIVIDSSKTVGSYKAFYSSGTAWYAKNDTSASAGGGALVGVATSNFTTTSTSYVDVTGCSVSVEANATYAFTAQGTLQTDDTGTMTLQFAYPSGATARFIFTTQTENDATTTLIWFGNQTKTFTGSESSPIAFTLTGKFVTSSTAGTFNMQVITVAPGTGTVYAGTGIQMVKQ